MDWIISVFFQYGQKFSFHQYTQTGSLEHEDFCPLCFAYCCVLRVDVYCVLLYIAYCYVLRIVMYCVLLSVAD
jgi:hypothetical protein